MINKLNLISIFIFILVIASIFHRWFLQSEIIGGDWPYLFKESLGNYSFLVPSWNTWQGNGLGGTNPIYFLQSFEYLTVFLTTFFHISWPIVYKIFWFGLFIFLSIFSSIHFLNVILKRPPLWQKLLAAIVFTTNTYILMLVDGGQMGVALSYAVAPLVLARFIKLIDHIATSSKNFQFSIFNFQLAVLAGLVLSLQVLFDPRISYITMIAAAIYMALHFKRNIFNTFYLAFYAFIIPGLITFLLHVFWLLPFLIFSQNICERFCEAYAGAGIVKFLSFSTFSQSLSLLHSNWPENIFGKVGFMKPEFIILPILAYMSLLFLTIKQFNNKAILFFVFLGLIGAFLAKGANPPFGGIYLWLFENVPGFVLFRDSTKFYLLVALAYSVLIPFSLYSLGEWLNSKLQFKSQNYLHIILLMFVVAYWTALIHPAILGQLRGTFKKHEVPKAYIELKDFLHKESDFFRILWVPRQQRFVFYSKIHPSVEAGALFEATSSAQVIKNIKEKGPQYFSELSVKYIVVPYDSLGEVFQKDRKYDSKMYENTVEGLRSISWLRKINGFGKIEIFEVPSTKDHLWLMGDGLISHKMIDSTHYSIGVSLNYSQKLIFSEKYNQSWVVKIGDKMIKSEKTLNNLNSFVLEKGDYNFEIIFLQDKVYNYGRAISLAAFVGILFFILKYKKSNVLSK